MFLFPLIWMFSTALKTTQQVYMIPMEWIPNPFVWQNFPDALNRFPFWRFLGNSLITSLLPVIGALISCSLVAYSFARVRWPGRDFWFIIVISTMMLPPQVTLIPVYVIFARLGWVNTFYPLVVPWFFGSAFFIFLMRQFFKGIPMELSDAAFIDGCSHLGILWRIILPLSKPALATVGIFVFLGTWNSLLGPVIYLTNERLYTLQIGLTYFRSEYSVEWQELMAASLVVLSPTLLIFFLGQRYFVRGLTLTGIKG
ncbi:MAG: carbohydrate ABC transporter permease [Caldilineaceae bacterium]|nr:carbohydrate ABC transporter permease [Caldilineaceae bacterium]